MVPHKHAAFRSPQSKGRHPAHGCHLCLLPSSSHCSTEYLKLRNVTSSLSAFSIRIFRISFSLSLSATILWNSCIFLLLIVQETLRTTFIAALMASSIARASSSFKKRNILGYSGVYSF
uniref:Uncharacterized protein n=1 Tax=Anguilla anguilla TaxID=7936 RepID=A0A0E9RTA7_ANGAN